MSINLFNFSNEETPAGNVRVKLTFIFLVTCLSAFTQTVNVQLTFLQDSIMVGELFEVKLSSQQPKDIELFYPDSLYNYAPFEFVKKTWEPTVINEDTAIDVATYTLRTFSIDSTQYLSLPVFRRLNGDTLTYQSNVDTINIQFVLKALPEKIDVKTNTQFLWPDTPIEELIGIGLVIILSVVIVILWMVYRKQIIAYFKIRRLSKKHSQFLQQFEILLSKTKTSNTEAQNLLKAWKEFNEHASEKPYTKLTTKELQKLNDSEVVKALQHLDRSIYGKKPLVNIDQQYEVLREQTITQLNNRIKQLKEYGRTKSRSSKHL